MRTSQQIVSSQNTWTPHRVAIPPLKFVDPPPLKPRSWVSNRIIVFPPFDVPRCRVNYKAIWRGAWRGCFGKMMVVEPAGFVKVQNP